MMETCICDGRAIGTPGEVSMLATAEMSTGEQIKLLYGQLEQLQARLERVHRRHIDEGEFVPDKGEYVLRDEVSVSGRHATPCHDQGAVDSRPMTDRLPPEILMQIFELCLEEDEASVDDGAGFHEPRIPLLLCRVCREAGDVCGRVETHHGSVVEKFEIQGDGDQPGSGSDSDK
ncbi:hypothetical protein Agabi119p4_2091 [Agaricus bisporus var. burnettii]|uniref:F-box domain-containing protein n=1 Tax=Agaricus bisporus var. burnettii TaxID=192524 RepID=A0A8H7KK20_AGABI|nr:hypothetical protein Agabi119p4_2091 [Agaricus bisporus var. burnettii]